MSIKSYRYTNSQGVTSTKWYFSTRYKDSTGVVHQRKGTGFSTREECEKGLQDFKEHIIFMNMSHDVYGVPKRNADRPARGNYAAAGGNINRQKWEFMMRR